MLSQSNVLQGKVHHTEVPNRSMGSFVWSREPQAELAHKAPVGGCAPTSPNRIGSGSSPQKTALLKGRSFRIGLLRGAQNSDGVR